MTESERRPSLSTFSRSSGYFTILLLLLPLLLFTMPLGGSINVLAQEEYPYFDVISNFSADDDVFDVAVSPNGKYIGVSTKSYAYLLNSRGVLLHEPFPTLHFAWGVAVSDTGLMAVGATNRIWLYNSTGEVWNYDPRIDPVILKETEGIGLALRAFDVAISPDGRYIVASEANSYGFTKYLFLFESSSSSPVWRLPTERNLAVKSLAISNDGSVIVAGGNDGSISVKDRAANSYGNYLLEDKPDYDIETPVDVSLDGETVVSGNSLGTVFSFKRNGVWNLDEDEPTKRKVFAQRPVAGIALCSDYIFAISDDGIVQPLERTQMTLLKTFQYSNVRGQAIAVSENCNPGAGIVVTGHGNVATVNKLLKPIPESDSLPPVTEIIAAADDAGKPIPRKGSTEATSGTFTFEGEDNIEVDHFMCSFDDEAFSKCISPITRHSVSLGVHEFRVYAVDTSGNNGEAKQFHWNVCTHCVGPPFDIVVSALTAVSIGVIVMLWLLDRRKKRAQVTHSQY